MKAKRLNNLVRCGLNVWLGLILILFFPSIAACWSYSIKGRVVDMDTKQPIEGAVVGIKWIRYKLGVPGFNPPSVDLSHVERISDTEGCFEVPKYDPFNTEYWFRIYKSGYVCWHAEKVFPTYEKRSDFRLKDGMIIKLEPWKENYSRVKHALFTTDFWHGPLFKEATNVERGGT